MHTKRFYNFFKRRVQFPVVAIPSPFYTLHIKYLQNIRSNNFFVWNIYLKRNNNTIDKFIFFKTYQNHV